MTDYDKNLKPLVKPQPSLAPFGKGAYQQGDSNKAPVVRPQSSKSPFNLLKNKVTSSSSASLQKASKLSGRASLEGASVDLG